MSETLEDRKARIMAHLQKQGEGGFYDFPIAPALGDVGEMFDAWAALEDEERIEPVRGTLTSDLRVARFRVRAQLRLL